MRTELGDNDLTGKIGSVHEVHIVLGVPTFIVKWDNEKLKDYTPYEIKELKDLTYDPKHNWHQHEKDNGKITIPRQCDKRDDNININTCMAEKQVLRNVAQSENIALLRSQRPILLEDVATATRCSSASEFAPNNLTEENRRKNLNYDARTYQVIIMLDV
jgi:hypothetical protein